MIEAIVNSQKEFFKTGKTKTIAYRKQLLKQLQSELIKQEDHIVKALYDDFKKPEFESIITETAIVLQDLKRTLKHIDKWAKPKRVFPSLLNFPSSDFIYKEPYGTVLIIAPWNYPYQLALAPLIGAVAAGNTVVLKPSELTPNTSTLLSKIIKHVFPPEFVTVIEGGVDTSTQLLNQVWDYIFFTGSVGVGKIVAKAAAPNLTPITLELGGKNPCIIDKSANLKLAAKRIVWGKFVNAGQTCIAPDYILIDQSIKNDFYNFLKEEITNAFTNKPKTSKDFARIINEKNLFREFHFFGLPGN